ncbi:MAG: DUF3107 family protein [Actinobacteria bacterium]|nr:MAG: DUF3107 family protein [Actinomycetota bacterium]
MSPILLSGRYSLAPSVEPRSTARKRSPQESRGNLPKIKTRTKPQRKPERSKEERVIEVRIGIIESPKELILELEEESKELIEKVNAALEEGSGLVWLTDSKGKQIAVSAS